MKHTPGPWLALYKRKYDEWYVSVPASDVKSMRFNVFPEGVWGDTPQEAEANARLIAAAPDLLEACKLAESAIMTIEVNRIWNSHYSIDHEQARTIAEDDPPTIVLALRAAIAKATGD